MGENWSQIYAAGRELKIESATYSPIQLAHGSQGDVFYPGAQSLSLPATPLPSTSMLLVNPGSGGWVRTDLERREGHGVLVGKIAPRQIFKQSCPIGPLPLTT